MRSRQAKAGSQRVQWNLHAALGDAAMVLSICASWPRSPQRGRQEAASQDASRQEGVEPVVHKLRQVGAGCGLGLLEESRGVLLHRAVRRGLFRAMTLSVD